MLLLPDFSLYLHKIWLIIIARRNRRKEGGKILLALFFPITAVVLCTPYGDFSSESRPHLSLSYALIVHCNVPKKKGKICGIGASSFSLRETLQLIVTHKTFCRVVNDVMNSRPGTLTLCSWNPAIFFIRKKNQVSFYK